jgi:hypothetical protein
MGDCVTPTAMMKGMCIGCMAVSFFEAVQQRSGFSGVVEIMRQGAALGADAATQETWCHALAHLLDDDVSRISAANAGVIGAVLAALYAHQADAGVQLWGLNALAQLVCDVRQNCEQACREGAVDAILAAMQSHRKNVGVQTQACLVLKRLALLLDAMIYQLPVVTRAIDAVVITLQASHLDDADFKQMACGALAELVWHDPARCTRAGSFGGVAAVLAAMQKHAGDVGMQRAGARALGALLPRDPADSENCGNAVASGALCVIVAALKTHAQDAVMVAHCCGTLSRLLSSVDACEKALKAGVFDTVLATMKLYAGDAAVLENACLAFNNAAFWHSGVQATLVDAGSIDAVLAAMLAHKTHAGVQDRAIRALSELVHRNESARTKARDAGTIDACLAGMRTHAANASVQDAACLFIDAMCDDADSRRMMCRAGAIEEVVRFLHACASPSAVHTTVQASQACNTLIGLLQFMTSEEYCVKADAGAVEAVVTVMRQHSMHVDIQKCACELLDRLVFLSTENRIKARAAGAAATVSAAMQAHAGNADVVVRAYAALRALASDGVGVTPSATTAQPEEESPTSRIELRTVEEAVAALRCSHSDAAALLQACASIPTFFATSSVAASDSSAACSSSGALRAVEAVVAVLRDRRRDARLQEAACRALAALTAMQDCGKENAAAALRAGALPHLTAALRMHAADAAVQQHGQALLASLQLEEESAARAADAAMAALLAAEEAERTPASATSSSSKRKSKKKKSSGGDGSTAAAAGLSGGGAAAEAAEADAALAAAVHALSADAAPEMPQEQLADAAPPPSTAADDAKPSAQAARRRRRAATKAARRAAGDGGDGAAADTASAPADDAAPAAASAEAEAEAEAQAGPAAADAVAAAADDDAQPPLAAMAEQAVAPLPAPVPPPAALPPPPPVMKECCVCLDDILADELRLISPCGHRCICAECGAALLARPPARRLCPICSAPVGVVVRVYDV